MAYVKVAVKKKTGPKPKAKPIDPVTLMSEVEKLSRLRGACRKLVGQFKKNDSTLKHVHSTASKIKSFYLDELKSKGMNPEYFRIVSNKVDNMTADYLISMIPEKERGIYIKNKKLIESYISTIKDGGVEMVSKANTIRDLIKEVKRYDTKGQGKVAKIIVDYYRKIYNAEVELESAISAVGSEDIENLSVGKALLEYNFIKGFYFDDDDD